MTYSKIIWGDTFANTLHFDWKDSEVKYSRFRDGSIWAQAPSGIEDAWTTGRDYMLEVAIRWIPESDATNPTRTGWSGATGWDAFLYWAGQKNEFRWYPDRTGGTYITSYLVSPIGEAPTLEVDGTYRIQLVIRNANTAY